MPSVIFAPRAIQDLQRLRVFLQAQQPQAAQRAAQTILRSVQALGDHPQMGRTVAGLPESFREWVIDFGNSGYVARYRYDGETVTILALRHQKELWD